MESIKQSKHTFVICAYRESIFLEECILSLRNQTYPSNIIMVTSTPNQHIEELGKKYNIPLIVNEGEGGIAQDWNFGIEQCDSECITIAHQDDTYEPEYAQKVLQNIEKSKNPIIAFTDYGEIRKGQKENQGKLIKVKRTLLLPLRMKIFGGSRFVRRRILGLGNAICCPSVTYCMKNLSKPVFQIGLKSNLDWETWERLSRQKGSFIYVPEVLMHHRIHEESTTSELINANKRGGEDFEMFSRFWPKPVASLLTKVYSSSEKYNDV